MKINKFLLSSVLIAPFASVISITSCANSTVSVVIYAQNGTFANGSNVLYLNTKINTQLKDVANYETPKSNDDKLSFYKWIDSEGNTIKTTDLITKNTVVVADYAEKIETTNDFGKDNWRTVISHTYSELDFAKTYCSYTGQSKQEAISKINEWILTDANQKEIDVYGIEVKSKPKVRIVGVNQDAASDCYLNKPIFTFEFISSIDNFAYDLPKYDEKTEKVWFYEYDNSSIRYRLNNFLLYMIPNIVSDAIVPVNKITQKYGFGSTQYYTTSEKMFLFSGAEFNIKIIPTGGYPLEGAPYTFYNRTLDKSSYIKTNICSGLVERYYFRTPECPTTIDRDTSHFVMGVSQQGELNSEVKKEPMGICPGFCI